MSTETTNLQIDTAQPKNQHCYKEWSLNEYFHKFHLMAVLFESIVSVLRSVKG